MTTSLQKGGDWARIGLRPVTRHLQRRRHEVHCTRRSLSGKPADFAAVDTAAEDAALVAFTSGTTGVPKGRIHVRRDVLAQCEVVCGYWLKPEPDDVFNGTPPLAFTFGLGGLLCFPLSARAATVLLEKLTPPVSIQAIEHYRASIRFTSPTGYRQMSGLASQCEIGVSESASRPAKRSR